jgi:hypothetical protein
MARSSVNPWTLRVIDMVFWLLEKSTKLELTFCGSRTPTLSGTCHLLRAACERAQHPDRE